MYNIGTNGYFYKYKSCIERCIQLQVLTYVLEYIVLSFNTFTQKHISIKDFYIYIFLSMYFNIYILYIKLQNIASKHVFVIIYDGNTDSARYNQNLPRT